MCGITGFLHHDPARPADPAVLRRMNDAIVHRGPDDAGEFIRGPVALAMRRLAIIDLGGGHQPIGNEDGTVWIVFNGEIYNFQALRRDLEAKGHVFRTNSDTEAIVHAYEQWGDACVERLRGMFAFAIWDGPRRRLFIARDRLGKKPLYYGVHDGTLWFGSELKCLLSAPGFPRDPDWTALHHYLTLQYVPDPHSALAAARKLPPAHTLVWEDGATRVSRYWDYRFEPKWTDDDTTLRRRVLDTVTEAVRLRLISEVPLGAHLSGGIDSSIVVGVMASLSSRPVKTFSIGFEEAGFNETPYARTVAERFRTEHHEFIVKPEALDLLPDLIRHFDEPFADPAAIPTWHLSRLTRQHVTVALNGDGGDEAFAGYQRYFGDRYADLYRAVPRWLREHLLDPLLRLLPLDHTRPIETSKRLALRQLARAARLPRSASIIRWGGYFSSEQKAALYTPEMAARVANVHTHQLLAETFARAVTRSAMERTVYTDVMNYLPGALLPKVDRMTMAHSLEARSPFLDHEVIELAARIPARRKVRGQRTKVILREAFAHLLPPAVSARGKVGFGVPLGLWLRGPLRDGARERLLDHPGRLSEIASRAAVNTLLDEHDAGVADHGKRLWALLGLHEWFRQIG